MTTTRKGERARFTKRKFGNGRGGKRFTSKRRFNGGGRRTGGFLDKEIKFYDAAQSGQVLRSSTDGTLGLISLDAANQTMVTVSRGDGAKQRDGKKIIVKSLHVIGNVCAKDEDRNNAGNFIATPPSNVFMALVLDTQCNGTNFTSEQIYINKGGNVALCVSPLRNMEFSTRFKVEAFMYDDALKYQPQP